MKDAGELYKTKTRYQIMLLSRATLDNEITPTVQRCVRGHYHYGRRLHKFLVPRCDNRNTTWLKVWGALPCTNNLS